MSVQQLTLDGDRTDTDRTRPNTMLWCPTTEQYVLRSRRNEWPHDLIDISQRDVTDEVDDLSHGCNISTQTYRVEFVYEYREIVSVEASDTSEAKQLAEEKATYQGEYIDTIHSTNTAIGEESIATIDYLELHGLLPDDHEVTQDDLETLEMQEENA